MTDPEVEAVARALANLERTEGGRRPLPNPWRMYNFAYYEKRALTAIKALEDARRKESK